VRRPPPERGAGGRQALQDWGFDATRIDQLVRLGMNFRS
jgi:hypothetical protein